VSNAAKPRCRRWVHLRETSRTGRGFAALTLTLI
jgi:hypothetical protein